MIFPLNERAGYREILAQAKAAGLHTNKKLFNRLSLLAGVEDELFAPASRSSDPGCAIRLRDKGFEAINTFVIEAIIAAPDHLVNLHITALRLFAANDMKKVAEREQAAANSAAFAQDRRWEAEAQEKPIRALIGEIECQGIRLSLSTEGDDDQIVARGGNLSPQHKVWLTTRRRDVVDLLRDREHAARVEQVI